MAWIHNTGGLYGESNMTVEVTIVVRVLRYLEHFVGDLDSISDSAIALSDASHVTLILCASIFLSSAGDNSYPPS